MPRYLILAQSEASANALIQWRKALLAVGSTALFDSSVAPEPLIVERCANTLHNGTLLFEAVVDHIERAAGVVDSSTWGEVTVLVDTVQADQLMAVSEDASWNNLVAMLILALPEIRWVFGVIQGTDHGTGAQFPFHDHGLTALLRAEREPLFDPTGLRDWVIHITTNGRKELGTPRRSMSAAIVEDELDFALLHGYTAYRFGYRVDIITSWNALKDRLGAPRENKNPYHLILDDQNLQFPGKPLCEKIAELSYRKDCLPALGKPMPQGAKGRFLVTAGSVGVDRELSERNKQFLDETKDQLHAGLGGVVFKPVGGIHKLWNKLCLNSGVVLPGQRVGNADGFIWPPLTPNQVSLESGSHSSPGKIGLVASILLRRAQSVLADSKTTADLFRASVLACNAAELLAYGNPTTTLGAIAIRHEAELRAECAFVGSGYNLNIHDRIREIQEEAKAIGIWFGEKSEQARWDAEVSMLNRLVPVLRDAGRFDEEHECLVALRLANRKLQLTQASISTKIVKHWPLKYAEWLLASLLRQLLISTLLVLSITAVAGNDPIARRENAFWPLSLAIGAFFGQQIPPANATTLLQCSGLIGILFGIFHISILISYFYSLISRK